MPDLRLNTALNVTNDVKARPADSAGEMSNSQFLEVMMSRLSEMSSQDDELKNLLGRVAQKNGTDKADNDALLNHLKKMADKSPVERTEPVKKADVKEKIKAKVKEIAESDPTPVKETKALKALQKVAKFLADANESGEISLPPEMVQKLQEFIAKGDDLKAFDIASFMTEFNDLFKSMIVNMHAQLSNTNQPMQWPQEVTDAFNDLGMKALTSEDKPLDMMTVMRALKSLVNQSEKAAMQTLNDKANAAVAAAQGQLPVVETQAAASAITAETPAAHKAVGAAQELQMTAMGLPVEKSVTKKENASLTQTATKTETADADAHPKDVKPSDMQSRYVSAESVAKATAQSAPTLAADVKAAFTVTTPVVNSDAHALHMAKAEAVAAPGSLAAKTAVANQEMMRETVKPSPVTQQIMAQIQTRGNKSTQISVQLTPAELGRVEVRLSIAKDGQTHAVVVADKPETLALLQKDASHLERSLQQAGLNANAGNMSFNLRDQQQAQQFGQGRKRFSRDTLGDVTTKEVSLNALAEAAIISDTRINYHA